MTRRHLLAECDSRELTLWQCYLGADAERIEQQRKEAEVEANLKRWVNASD